MKGLAEMAAENDAPSYSVMFCCNDDRGNPTDRVEVIEVGDEIRIAGPSRSMRRVMHGVKIGRRRYATSGMWISYVGNLLWDATSMTTGAALALVTDLLADGWTVEEYAEDGPFAALARRAP
jgi:hypothetical protein